MSFVARLSLARSLAFAYHNPWRKPNHCQNYTNPENRKWPNFGSDTPSWKMCFVMFRAHIISQEFGSHHLWSALVCSGLMVVGLLVICCVRRFLSRINAQPKARNKISPLTHFEGLKKHTYMYVIFLMIAMRSHDVYTYIHNRPSSQHNTCRASQRGGCLGLQQGTCFASQQ